MKPTASHTNNVPGRHESGEGPCRPLGMIFDEDELVGICILDHVIVGDGECASFKAAGLLRLRRDAGDILDRGTKLS